MISVAWIWRQSVVAKCVRLYFCVSKCSLFQFFCSKVDLHCKLQFRIYRFKRQHLLLGRHIQTIFHIIFGAPLRFFRIIFLFNDVVEQLLMIPGTWNRRDLGQIEMESTLSTFSLYFRRNIFRCYFRCNFLICIHSHKDCLVRRPMVKTPLWEFINKWGCINLLLVDWYQCLSLKVCLLLT